MRNASYYDESSQRARSTATLAATPENGSSHKRRMEKSTFRLPNQIALGDSANATILDPYHRQHKHFPAPSGALYTIVLGDSHTHDARKTALNANQHTLKPDVRMGFGEV